MSNLFHMGRGRRPAPPAAVVPTAEQLAEVADVGERSTPIDSPTRAREAEEVPTVRVDPAAVARAARESAPTEAPAPAPSSPASKRRRVT